MKRMHLERLVAAAAWGASLAVGAGCGGSTTAGTMAGSDAGHDAIADATPEAGHDAKPDSPTLQPYPDNLGCSGPTYDSGYYGQCCYEALCQGTVNGACPPPDSVESTLPGFPPGSGTCQCGDPVAGPYAPHSASEGPCCYVVGSISCMGRPLLVGGVPRLAPVVERADWARPGRAWS